MRKSDLESTLKDLKEMKQAFIDKGDEERAENKKKFLREQRSRRGGDKYEDEEQEEEEEEKGYDEEKKAALNEKMKIVEQIGKMKKQRFNN